MDESQLSIGVSWGISDTGIDMFLNANESVMSSVSIDAVVIEEELNDVVQGYLLGEESSDVFDEWEQFADNLIAMACTIKKGLQGVYYSEAA